MLRSLFQYSPSKGSAKFQDTKIGNNLSHLLLPLALSFYFPFWPKARTYEMSYTTKNLCFNLVNIEKLLETSSNLSCGASVQFTLLALLQLNFLAPCHVWLLRTAKLNSWNSQQITLLYQWVKRKREKKWLWLEIELRIASPSVTTHSCALALIISFCLFFIGM